MNTIAWIRLLVVAGALSLGIGLGELLNLVSQL